MEYKNKYKSPLGNILITANEYKLTGLWFEGQKYYPSDLEKKLYTKNAEIFGITKKWLDIYFSGNEPDFTPEILFKGTDFQISVWQRLLEIPYGKTVTYGEIAKSIASEKELLHMSAQAVGGAVGHNKISLIVPCHRVLGRNNLLTGYAGGLDKKLALLKLEGSNIESKI